MSLEDAIRDHAAALRDIAAAIRERPMHYSIEHQYADAPVPVRTVSGPTTAPKPENIQTGQPVEEAPGKSRKKPPAQASTSSEPETPPSSAQPESAPTVATPPTDSSLSSTSSSDASTPPTTAGFSSEPSTGSSATLTYADIQQPFLKELIAKQGRQAGIDFLKAMGLADGQTLKDLPEARWPEALVELRKRIGS